MLMRPIRRQPEKAIQAHIVRLLKHVGCQVYVLGTHRRRGDYQGTMQTAGLPDVLAFLPRAMGLLFVEVKSPKGTLRPEQVTFRDAAVACQDARPGVYYATGGLDAVIITLMVLGLLKADQVASYHTTLAQQEDAQDETDAYRAAGGRAR